MSENSFSQDIMIHWHVPSAAQLQWCRWSSWEQSPGRTGPPVWASASGWSDDLTRDTEKKTDHLTFNLNSYGSDRAAQSLLFRTETFCGVEDCSRFPASGLPVDAVRQRTDKIFLTALHDLLTHLVEFLCVVYPAVELSISIGEFCTNGKASGKTLSCKMLS